MAKRGEIFQVAPLTTPNSSWFDMSNENLLSCNAGTILPHNVVECLAGDKLKNKSYVFGRCAPMLAPTFGKCDIMTYDFYVRYRDLWPDFDEFITNQSQDKAVVNSTGWTPPQMPSIPFNSLVHFGLSEVDDNTLLGVYPHFSETTSGQLRLSHDNYYVVHIKFTPDSDGRFTIFSEILYPWNYLADWSTADYFIPFDETTGCFNFYFACSYGREEYEYLLEHGDDMAISNFATSAISQYNYCSQGDLLEMLGIDCSAFSRKLFDQYIKQMSYDVVNQSGSLDSSVAEAMINIINNHTEDMAEIMQGKIIYCLAWNYGNDLDQQYNQIGSFNGTYSNKIGDSSKYYVRQFNNELYANSANISLLPIAAYNFIYDEYFRDQNYIDKSIARDVMLDPVFLQSYIDSPHLLNGKKCFEFLTLRRKAYMHDPYTSALPEPQRGEAVRFLSDAQLRLDMTPGELPDPTRTSIDLYATDHGFVADSIQTAQGMQYESGVVVDLSTATIENFRWANAMQKYLEAVSRTGGRYYEYMLGIFGKDIPDSKINRPIYLNGNRTPLQISEVLQTSQTDTETFQPLGDMAGRGIINGSDDFIEYDCPDHGLFIQLCVVVPRTAYMSGLNPMFTRETYMDYPIPQFAQLGEEYVRKSELWFDGTQQSIDKPFGYQSRYYQWKYRRDEVHGDFKSSLDFWHWSRKFSEEPTNGQEFLEINPDYRQFAVTDKSFDHFYLYFDHNLQMLRPLPTFGIPSL